MLEIEMKCLSTKLISISIVVDTNNRRKLIAALRTIFILTHTTIKPNLLRWNSCVELQFATFVLNAYWIWEICNNIENANRNAMCTCLCTENYLFDVLMAFLLPLELKKKYIASVTNSIDILRKVKTNKTEMKFKRTDQINQSNWVLCKRNQHKKEREKTRKQKIQVKPTLRHFFWWCAVVRKTQFAANGKQMVDPKP